jgi:hypothetical protein
MPRVIRYFGKLDELLAGEYVLPPLDVVLLQDIFSVAEDNPMYDSFPVGEEQAKILALHFPLKFDMGKFDYFLEYEE